MDTIDRVIWVLPVLAFLDVASTFYALNSASMETGYLASIFIGANLLFVYVIIYPVIIIATAYGLYQIKGKLNPYNFADKAIFLFLVGAACFAYMRLTEVFIMNFFLSTFIARGIDLFSISIVIYLATFASLALYIWREVVEWVKSREERK